MKSITVSLPTELMEYIDQSLADGEWDTADQLIAAAVISLRTATMMGQQPNLPTRPKAKEEVIPLMKSKHDAVDLTRQGFDSTLFMEGLINKIQSRDD